MFGVQASEEREARTRERGPSILIAKENRLSEVLDRLKHLSKEGFGRGSSWRAEKSPAIGTGSVGDEWQKKVESTLIRASPPIFDRARTTWGSGTGRWTLLEGELEYDGQKKRSLVRGGFWNR